MKSYVTKTTYILLITFDLVGLNYLFYLKVAQQLQIINVNDTFGVHAFNLLTIYVLEIELN